MPRVRFPGWFDEELEYYLEPIGIHLFGGTCSGQVSCRG